MARGEFQGSEFTYSMELPSYQPFNEDSFDIKNDYLNLYASVPPWEYIMHYTAAKFNQAVVPNDCDMNKESKGTKKLKYLFAAVDEVLNELKNHVISTCCSSSVERDKPNNPEEKENYVLMSEKMSIILGLNSSFATELYVVDDARMDMEYNRCSSVVDAVVQMLCYKDTDDTNLIFDEMSSVPQRKQEEIETRYVGYETNNSSFTTNDTFRHRSLDNTKEQKDLLNVEHAEHITNSLSDNLCYPNKCIPVGYSPRYCIPEPIYNDIILNGKPYTCKCDRKFNNRNIFESHLDGKCLGKDGEIRRKEQQPSYIKLEEHKLQCLSNECNQLFTSVSSLYRHHQKVHLKGMVCPYRCDKCEKTFFLKILLNTHYKEIHFEELKELCKICGEDMKTPRKLRLHLKSHNEMQSEGTDVPLPIKQEAQDNVSVKVSLENNDKVGKKTFSPKIKHKKTRVRVTLRPAKVQAPDIPERYPCGKKRYKPVGYYPEYSISKERYISIISSGKPYICACQKQFVHRHTFERHLYGHCLGENGENKRKELHAKWRKDDDGIFHCLFPGCTEKFKYNLSLYSHHQKEHLEGVECPFKCVQCDKSFFLRSLLNCHVKDTHEKRSSQNSQVCDICGKDVIRNQMKLHMMRHTGEKPFQCSYCEYRGLTNSAVLQHVKHVHEPHKFTLHFCDMCGKDCKTKAHLKEHMLTHSDIRTFLCKMCGKYLKNRNSFGRHMVRVHKISHRCSHCGVDYFTLQGLQIHLLKVHNITS